MPAAGAKRPSRWDSEDADHAELEGAGVVEKLFAAVEIMAIPARYASARADGGAFVASRLSAIESVSADLIATSELVVESRARASEITRDVVRFVEQREGVTARCSPTCGTPRHR